jgi:hypothetical protein
MKGIVVIVMLLAGGASLNPGYELAHSWQTSKVAGRWHVKYTLRPNGEKNLIIEVRGDGSATITPLDSGPDDKPTAPQPAIWSQTTQNRINFSTEVELPYGTCCREVGTLMLKGKLEKDDSISGKSVFVTSTTEEENVIGFRSMVGSFTAVRERLNSK